MPPAATTTRDLVDRLLNGKLAFELSCRHDAEKQSFDTIARWLLVDHGVNVSGETIRRWYAELVPF